MNHDFKAILLAEIGCLVLTGLYFFDMYKGIWLLKESIILGVLLLVLFSVDWKRIVNF